jgi:hypothetical protein
MRGAFALALALAAAPAAAERRQTGSVIYATASRLYLDAGAKDGLVPGQMLRLKAGTCRVEEVSDRYATCAGSARPGDTFVLPLPPPAQVVRRLPPPPPPAVLEQRRAMLASVSFDKVDYHAPSGPPPASHTSEVGVGYAGWFSTGAAPWQQERLDARLTGAPIGAGFTLDVDMSARWWSRRSDPISFRPDDPAQLYVWEAALSRRSLAGGPAISLGRVRPWGTPGQSIFDGAQAGWRTSGGTEMGVFGGAIPDAVTLAPSFGQGTLGGYWSGLRTGESGSILRYFRHELRLALVNTSELGKRLEVEGLLEARITRRFDMAVDVRMATGAPGAQQAPGLLDAIRLDGAYRPLDGLSFIGSFRYEGLPVPELDGPGNVLAGGAARHADLSLAWDPTPQIRVTMLSGLSTDLSGTGQTRRWIGPELGAPRLFSDRVGASVGYVHEDGWEPGQSAWLQFLLRPGTLVQVMTRVFWSRTRSAAAVDLDELGAYARVQAQLGRFVALRVSATGRTTLNGESELFGGNTGQSGTLDAEISGQF